jgi:hypothetical protein
MRNPKALAATDQSALFKTLLQDPEITAMAAITEILNELPDDTARMRVMRWSFGRFGEEFKRPLPDAIPAPVTSSPLQLARPVEPVAPVRQAPEPSAVEVAAPPGAQDFASEISELKDLFQHPRQIVAGSFA